MFPMMYKLVLFYHQKAANLADVYQKNASHLEVKKLYIGSVVDAEDHDTIGKNVRHQFLYPIKMETLKWLDGTGCWLYSIQRLQTKCL
ncbi:hypothetical protein Q3G72_004811 [Acer saccharum]|nr:hypothetical protein Q3G72_004811 [Acer saccharum]